MKTIEELGISPMPWSWSEDREGMIVDANCHDVAMVCYESERDFIKSAPDMYEALLAVWNEYEESDLQCGISRIDALMCKVEKALAKAGGEEVEQ